MRMCQVALCGPPAHTLPIPAEPPYGRLRRNGQASALCAPMPCPSGTRKKKENNQIGKIGN